MNDLFLKFFSILSEITKHFVSISSILKTGIESSYPTAQIKHYS